MEQDHLKTFIEQNRAEFDSEYPSLRVWAAIEKQLPESGAAKLRRLAFTWSKAAAIALLIVATGWIGYQWGMRQGGSLAVDSRNEQLFQELAETEQFYQQKIAPRQARLTQQLQDPRLDADLAEIDRAMEELRAELSVAPPGTEAQLVERLIQQYRLKLQLLEYIQEKLEKANENATKYKQDATEI